jgi:adenosylmethionine-8-amino-7-oxononanoate aminotransferase
MLQGAAGMIVSPPGFLKEVRRLTKKYGVLLIADEVATGFGRTGKMFACEVEGVVPDFLCLAKGITGGYMPLAATLTTDKVYRAFLGKYEEYRSFFHGHTYTGNPLGSAAALANLDIFENERVIEGLGPKIKLFKKLLQSLDSLPHVGEVRQIGLVAGIELVKNKKTKEPFPAKSRVGYRACLSMRDSGVILRPLGDVVVIMPPLSIKDSELKKIVETAYKGIKEITERPL